MEIISKEIIKPSSPTSHHLQTFKLSLLDQLTLHTYAPIILLYESTINSIDVFKKSLSQTLTKYYPFAGRLRDDGITLDCNDQGVVFIEAKLVHHKLSDFLQNPNYETQKLLFPEGFLWKGSCIGYPFLAAQVTYFNGGGTAVTVSLSHKVADAPSLGIFLSDWAAMARGEARPPPLILATSIPSFDLAYTMMPEIVIEMSEKTCVTKRFVFDSVTISRLKRSVIGLVENPTKTGLVTALLYRCAIAASTAKTGGFRNSTLIQLVNMRKLPEKSVGNFTWYFTISNDRESETDLGNLVVQLKKGIKELRDNFRLEDWLIGVRESANNVKELFDNLDVYRFSHVRGGSFYEMDFGFGNPKWGTIADVLVKNAFVLYDTPDGNGVEAVVSLEEEHMRLFESNEELVKFISIGRSRI